MILELILSSLQALKNKASDDEKQARSQHDKLMGSISVAASVKGFLKEVRRRQRCCSEGEAWVGVACFRRGERGRKSKRALAPVRACLNIRGELGRVFRHKHPYAPERTSLLSPVRLFSLLFFCSIPLTDFVQSVYVKTFGNGQSVVLSPDLV